MCGDLTKNGYGRGANKALIVRLIIIASFYCLQAIYGEYGCDVIDAGENIIKGPLVIAWQKDFVYGPLLDY